mmetsp:Transcript_1270/g.2822  ORF Transcript_1270/g.2822 Transcript_1270/m.2822 type:complete len:255 (-) Transcript_1270:41-805(-)|eukprot:CAMPEP_0114540032 /NCGR_PEP_ID=MMETSP0114-20121206/550_1 /TAXON_ID=31324 /ORGANISM="Goniomonas sp, Strain m" /LENGTH=254 /DNA_ID=CAMNT_0001724165 /DNA_START=94 /DNA_END=858 /DNA_ORIENTATION=+
MSIATLAALQPHKWVNKKNVLVCEASGGVIMHHVSRFLTPRLFDAAMNAMDNLERSTKEKMLLHGDSRGGHLQGTKRKTASLGIQFMRGGARTLNKKQFNATPEGRRLLRELQPVFDDVKLWMTEHHPTVVAEMQEVVRRHPALEDHLICGLWTYIDVNLTPISKQHYDRNDNPQVPACILSFGKADLVLPHAKIRAKQARGSMALVNSFKYQHGIEINDKGKNRRSVVLSAHNAFRMSSNDELIRQFLDSVRD